MSAGDNQSICASDTTTELPKHPNRFIAKTFHIVNSSEPYACWVASGKRFLILDVNKFSKTILPKYFKHCKFTSFVRQLNFYGFRKQRIKSPSDVIDSKNYQEDSDEDSHSTIQKEILNNNIVCFQHDLFQANRQDLLKLIQRSNKHLSVAPGESAQEKEFNEMKAQVNQMRERIDSIAVDFETKLERMKTEMEIDYLHRIKAIEVCYKDLANMVVNANKELSVSSMSSSSSAPSSFPLPSLPQNPMAATPRIGPPINSNRLLLDAKYAAQRHFAEQRAQLLSGMMNNRSQLPAGNCSPVPTKNLLVKEKGYTGRENASKQPMSAASAYMNGLRLIESFQKRNVIEKNGCNDRALLEKLSAAQILGDLSS